MSVRRLRWSAVLASVALLAACTKAPRRDELPWSGAQQLVLVTTPDWNATRGTLRTFTRAGSGWSSAGDAVPVVIGRSGAAWGVGLHPPQAGGPTKREGDGRSPAGVFALGTAFGYAPSEPFALPYRALGAEDYCVDVSGSPLYNRIVSRSEVGDAAVAGSTEPMRRDLHAGGDEAYKIGLVIEHNPRGLAGAGSCIFVHLWNPVPNEIGGAPTSGCTALAEPALRALLGWLRPEPEPVFVLLPEHEYRRLRAPWRLPAIEGNP